MGGGDSPGAPDPRCLCRPAQVPSEALLVLVTRAACFWAPCRPCVYVCVPVCMAVSTSCCMFSATFTNQCSDSTSLSLCVIFTWLSLITIASVASRRFNASDPPLPPPLGWGGVCVGGGELQGFLRMILSCGSCGSQLCLLAESSRSSSASCSRSEKAGLQARKSSCVAPRFSSLSKERH